MTAPLRPSRRGAAFLGIALSAVALASCGGERGRTPEATASDTTRAGGAPATGAPVPTAQQLVDSALRVFRRGLPQVDRLEGGAASREELVRSFVAAAAVRDTGALRRMLLTRGEFAWLYFPEARLAQPPYGIDPAFLWLQMGSNTDRDLPKAFAALTPRAGYVGHQCPDSVVAEGRNRVHERCLVFVVRGSGRDTLSLFGSIVERDGRFKFLSYANRL